MKYFTFQIRESPRLKVLSLWLFALVILSTMTAVLVVNQNQNDGKRLELVQVLFRHGERTPSEDEYATIPYAPASAYAPFGFGQLTNNGRVQAYELGLSLRGRYQNYLDQTYNPRELYACSSENDRTMATMQLVLAGLYPPTSSFLWNPALNWLPIPYRYTPAKFDPLFKPFLSQTFAAIFKRETHRVIRAKNNAEYSDIIEILEADYGLDTSTAPPTILANVYNTLHCNEKMDIALPDWCTKDVLARLRNYMIFALSCNTYTQEMKRIIGGALIKSFVHNMNLNETMQNPRQIYLYSGHDINIDAVLRSLAVKHYDYPDYSSAIIFEKLRDVDNRLYVRLVGRRNAEEEFQTFKIGDCDEFCPIEDFLTIAQDVLPSDKEMHLLENEFQGRVIDDLFLNDPYVKERQ